MPPDTTNGRITLAVISSQLEAVIKRLDIQDTKLDAIQRCQDQMAHIPGDVDDLQADVDTLKTDMAKVKERSGIIGIINAAFTGLAATIAGYIGSR